MSTATGGTPPFTVGNVLRISWSVVRRNAMLIALGGAIFSVGIHLVGLFVGDLSDPVLQVVVVYFLRVVLMALLAVALSYVVACDARGRRASPLGALRAAGAGFGPVLALMLIWNVVSAVGSLDFGANFVNWLVGGWATFVLTYVPLVFLWTAFPSAALERRGIVAALSRAFGQTQGHRLQALGLVALPAIVSFIAVPIIAASGRPDLITLAVWLVTVFYLLVTQAVSFFLLGGTPVDGVLPESGDEKVLSAFD